MSSFLNRVADNFADIVIATKRALREMQHTPLGTEERSRAEQAALWRKMRMLPPEDFNSMLDIAAMKVGHRNDEEQPCEVCSFVIRHAEMEGRRRK